MTEPRQSPVQPLHYRLATIMFIALALHACQREEDNIPQQAGSVLVRVNGEAIRQQDVEIASVSVLGATQAGRLDQVAQKKILESLILSKIISQVEEKKLAPDEKNQIARQVENYREILLVKRYLRHRVQPIAVTKPMIKARYEKYPQRYGARRVQDYLVLSSRNKVQGVEREKLIKALDRARTIKDWQRYVTRQKRAGVEMVLSRGKSDEKLLQTSLRQVMESLQLNDTSKSFLLGGKPYLVRIIAETRIEPKPLNEVSAEINKELLPEQLNKAILQLSTQLRKSAKIEYTNTGQGGKK